MQKHAPQTVSPSAGTNLPEAQLSTPMLPLSPSSFQGLGCTCTRLLGTAQPLEWCPLPCLVFCNRLRSFSGWCLPDRHFLESLRVKKLEKAVEMSALGLPQRSPMLPLTSPSPGILVLLTMKIPGTGILVS